MTSRERRPDYNLRPPKKGRRHVKSSLNAGQTVVCHRSDGRKPVSLLQGRNSRGNTYMFAPFLAEGTRMKSERHVFDHVPLPYGTESPRASTVSL